MAKFDNVPGIPGYYVSRNGKVYSRYNPGNHLLTEKYHRICRRSVSDRDDRNNMYYRVRLGKRHLYLHRLVATCWLPNPNNLPCVGHKDNNPWNNRVDNLYWVTQKENLAQMIRDGRSLIGSRNSNWKPKNVDKICQMYADKVSLSDIANSNNLDVNSVRKVIRNKFIELWQERKLKSQL